jgi:uncharacterized protein (TIGR00159 family)
MIEYALKIIKTLRILDAIDIAIISFMISAILIWFKDRASRFVFFGITLLGIIYILARFFELYLTTVFLQSFFAILLFVLVVIFQEDFRRFFERIAMLGRFRKMFSPATAFNESTDILAETAADFARKKIGALIVIQGRDPLDRHLVGGQELAGMISKSLLESIFDPHSAGHDGAVLVEGNRVMKFGCHLPLSANVSEHGNLGLRHTAALGLSERSDAICIVVSEESGSISVARGEKIEKIANAAALRVDLEAFFEKNGAHSKEKPFLRWFKENEREKGIAVVLACVLWVVFGYQQETIRREFTIPIEYINAPMELVMDEPRVSEANVMLMGRAQAFQLLNSEDMKISIDLEKIQPGRQQILLTRKMLKNAPNLNVTNINPERITLSTSRLLPVSVPIEVMTDNSPPPGIEVESISVTPKEARVVIPKGLRGKRVRIITEPIDLSQLDVQRAFTPSIRYPKDVHFVGGKTPVVRVVIKTKHPAPAKDR